MAERDRGQEDRPAQDGSPEWPVHLEEGALMGELVEGDLTARQEALRTQLAQTLHKVLVQKRQRELERSIPVDTDPGLLIRAKDRFAPRPARSSRPPRSGRR